MHYQPQWLRRLPRETTSILLTSFGCLLLLSAHEAAAATTRPAVHVVQAPTQCLVPDVLVDAAGILHMVYGLEHHAYYVRSDNNGATFTPPVKVKLYWHGGNQNGRTRAEVSRRRRWKHPRRLGR